MARCAMIFRCFLWDRRPKWFWNSAYVIDPSASTLSYLPQPRARGRTQAKIREGGRRSVRAHVRVCACAWWHVSAMEGRAMGRCEVRAFANIGLGTHRAKSFSKSAGCTLMLNCFSIAPNLAASMLLLLSVSNARNARRT